jgi:host factor-I protein
MKPGAWRGRDRAEREGLTNMRRYDFDNQDQAPNEPRQVADQANRKLIRPNLSELKDRLQPRQPRRKQVPPESTNAEAFYYLKQMNSKTQMVVVLKDGEELRGVIEWYDRNCIKVNRVGAPNLMVMKDCIRYMYKADEQDESRSTRSDGI